MRSTHLSHRVGDMTPIGGVFGLSLFFKISRLLGSFGNRARATSLEQLSRIVVDFHCPHLVLLAFWRAGRADHTNLPDITRTTSGGFITDFHDAT